MVKLGIARDLSILTAAKLFVLVVIYVALFAPFASRPDDTAVHLLGSLPQDSASHTPAPGGS
jgi:hypothetical protein